MRVSLFKMLILFALFSTVSAGCAVEGSSGSDDRIELLVFAAASLSDSLFEIKPLFEDRYPNVKVSFNLASSGTLQRQIEQGAPADVFISAGEHEIDALVEQQAVRRESVERFVGNRLAVIVPEASELPMDRLEELKSEQFTRIAVGQPQTVPAGLYAKQSLQSEGLWEPLANKLVYGKDVRSVLSIVETGNADAGFVYVTDAKRSDKVRIAFLPDEGGYDAIAYPAAVVNGSAHPAEAEAFVHFLQEDEVLGIFIKSGFTDLR